MIASLNHVRLFYDVLSDGLRVVGGRARVKPPLVVLHGGPGMDHQDLKPVVRSLADRYQLVTFDQRGSGLSQRVPESRLSMAAMAGDIEALRRHLGLSRVILMGVSFGGMLALEYALRYPGSLRALILVVTAPSYRFKDQARRFADGLADPGLRRAAYKVLDGDLRSAADAKAALARLAPLYARRGDPRRSRRALRPIRLNVRVLRWFFRRGCARYDVEDRLGRIRAPTLIVGAERDWICPPDQSRILHRGIRGSRLVILPGARHACCLEQTPAVIGAIRRFLAGVRGCA